MYRITDKPTDKEALTIFSNVNLKSFTKVFYMYLVSSKQTEFDDDIVTGLLNISKSKLTRAKKELKEEGYWESYRINKTDYEVVLTTPTKVEVL